MNGILINALGSPWIELGPLGQNKDIQGTISNYQIVSTVLTEHHLMIFCSGSPWLELGALCGQRQEQGHRQGGPGDHAHGDQDDHEIFCVPLLGWLCQLDSIMVIEETNVYCSLFLLKKCFPFFGNAVIAGSERNMICTWRLYQCLIWCRTIFKRDYFPNPFSRVPFYVEFRL